MALFSSRFFFSERCVFTAILGILAVLTLAGCGKKEVADTGPVVRPVKTLVVGTIASGELTFPAVAEAGEKALLSFRVSGRLIELPIEEGQEVKEGQLIGRLEPQDFQIAINEAKAQFTKADADYRRYQQLYEKNAVPLAELELRRSQRDVARARLDGAEKNLRYTYLRAPFDGRIGRRYVENYMDVQAQQEIVDLNDVKNVEIIIDVSESVMKGIRAGLQASVYAVFAAVPGKEYPLELKELATRADPNTRTFRVTFLMPQPDEFNLLPGMTAEVKAVITATGEALEAQTISVPAIAVMGDDKGEGFVWVLDPGEMTVHKRGVKLGAMTGMEDVVILEGLEGGETLVVAGVTKLQEGMKVRQWEAQEQ